MGETAGLEEVVRHFARETASGTLSASIAGAAIAQGLLRPELEPTLAATGGTGRSSPETNGGEAL